MHEQEENQDYVPALNVLKSAEEPSKESYHAFLATLVQGEHPAKKQTSTPLRTMPHTLWFRRSFVLPGSIGVLAILLLVIFSNNGTAGKQALAETITGTDADIEASSIMADTIDFSDLELLDNDTSEINEL